MLWYCFYYTREGLQYQNDGYWQLTSVVLGQACLVTINKLYFRQTAVVHLVLLLITAMTLRQKRAVNVTGQNNQPAVFLVYVLINYFCAEFVFLYLWLVFYFIFLRRGVCSINETAQLFLWSRLYPLLTWHDTRTATVFLSLSCKRLFDDSLNSFPTHARTRASSVRTTTNLKDCLFITIGCSCCVGFYVSPLFEEKTKTLYQRWRITTMPCLVGFL